MNPTVAMTLAVSLCICSSALGEQIEWNDATCSYKLTFDARKVDRDALKGTIDILFNELPYIPTDQFFRWRMPRALMSASWSGNAPR